MECEICEKTINDKTSKTNYVYLKMCTIAEKDPTSTFCSAAAAAGPAQ